jgi:hypothetical protein
VSKHARAKYDALDYTAGVTIVAAIVLVPLVLVSGQSLKGVPLHGWFWIGLLAIVPGAPTC